MDSQHYPSELTGQSVYIRLSMYVYLLTMHEQKIQYNIIIIIIIIIVKRTKSQDTE